MNGHFSPRSLAFYGIAIVSVVVLFSIATAFGESKLKAPRNIDGQYAISDAALPGCLSGKKSALIVQQSGIYITGALIPADADERVIRTAKERPLLHGDWNNRELTLRGSLAYLTNCQEQISIVGTIEQDTLSGQLQLGANTAAVPFTAQRAAVQKKTEGGH